MTAPSWVKPKTRLFLVAYEGADGRPYALALSDHGIARRMGGEVIDTLVDNHADVAADGDADRAAGHEKIRR